MEKWGAGKAITHKCMCVMCPLILLDYVHRYSAMKKKTRNRKRIRRKFGKGKAL